MRITRKGNGFTLMEILVVTCIIALLAALVIGSGNPASPKRRLIQSQMYFIESALERYKVENGEFPEPLNADEAAEIIPGKTYCIGPAKCLYQALCGDGNDAIKGVDRNERGQSQSDGTISADEIKNTNVVELPETMLRKVGGSYILVDAFGHPFQYIKAGGEKQNTINSTYDLWSYAEDDKNVMSRSKDAEANPSLGAKWIKNW